MKYVFLASIFILTNLIQVLGQNKVALDYADKISAKRIKQDVYKLSSDLMEGRETGKKGQKLAAQYIYKQFADAMLQNNSEKFDSLGYFQKFIIYKQKSDQAIIISNGKKLKNSNDLLISGLKDYSNDSLEFIFLGTAPLESYQNKNFKNKAILFLTSNLYAGAIKSNDIVNSSGAKLVLFCDPNESGQFSRLHSIKKHQSSRRLKLEPKERKIKNPYDSITANQFYKNFKNRISTYQGAISITAASKLLNVKSRNLRKAHSKKKTIKNQNESKYIKFNYELKYDQIHTENVIALLPGTDKKDEFIVVSAHYDHVGRNGTEIFNGANDNASGTASIIELARSFQKANKNGHANRRSILFVAFTGEEKGLLGSRYFVDNTNIAMNKIKANLNIDMLGRKDHNHSTNNYVYLLGASHLNPKLKIISDSINQLTEQLILDYKYDSPQNYLYMASDQASFVKKNVPAIFYFNGLHKDYHKTSDTADKLDYNSIKKVTQLVFLTAWQLANQN